MIDARIPTVSIIMPIRNGAAYLERALGQLAAPARDALEFIVIDDASTDETVALLEQARAAGAEFTLVAAPEWLGLAAVRNLGVSLAKGDYIWFVDCDDVWEDGILAALRAVVAETGVDIATCGAERVSPALEPHGATLDGIYPSQVSGPTAVTALLVGEIRGYLWNKIIRRSLLLDYSFPAMTALADFAMIAELVFAGASFGSTGTVLYRHVENIGSITNSKVRSFDNLERCLSLVVDRLEASSPSAENRRAFVFFRQWFFVTAAVNTGLRFGAGDAVVEARIREIRRGVRWRDLPTIARFSPRQACIGALHKLPLGVYRKIYLRRVARTRGALIGGP